MGALLKRWRREESAEEVLESLELQLQRLESIKQRDEQRYKKFIGLFMFYSVLVYIMAAILFYLYYFPKLWKDRVVKSTPLLIFPLVIFAMRKTLQYYFVSQSKRNSTRLDEVRAKKHKIIEDVKEKETYKKAKEILEKYDPDCSLLQSEAKPDDGIEKPAVPTPGTEVRQRRVNTQNISAVIGTSPRTPLASSPLRAMTPAMQRQFFINNVPPGTPPGPPRPIPVRPKERTYVDKFVDYMVGDGPNNRYALVCKACYSHNGMSLKEDFDYTTFRCCYCYHLNEAKKQRPSPPPLEGFASDGFASGGASKVENVPAPVEESLVPATESILSARSTAPGIGLQDENTGEQPNEIETSED